MRGCSMAGGFGKVCWAVGGMWTVQDCHGGGLRLKLAHDDIGGEVWVWGRKSLIVVGGVSVGIISRVGGMLGFAVKEEVTDHGLGSEMFACVDAGM